MVAVKTIGAYASWKIGVFICHCGGNLSDVLDVNALREFASKQDGVVAATDFRFMCSNQGQARLQDTIKEKGLDGVVVACCTPKMYEDMFRETAKSAGMNPYLLEIANVREQCADAHRREPDGPPDAWLLAQRLDQPGEVLGQCRRQDVRFPGVIFPVHDDGDVVASRVRHHRSIGCAARKEMVSDRPPLCPAFRGAPGRIYQLMTPRAAATPPPMVIKVTVCHSWSW